MIQVKPLSQRDPRWRRKRLGFSRLSIGNYGCTITCLTMLINHETGKNYGVDEVNDRLKRVRAFSGALVIWSRVPLAFPDLSWVKRGWNYSNATVAYYVYLLRQPVCVQVAAASIGAWRHWVLYLGGRKMADPWTGRIESTNRYPATGYALYT